MDLNTVSYVVSLLHEFLVTLGVDFIGGPEYYSITEASVSLKQAGTLVSSLTLFFLHGCHAYFLLPLLSFISLLFVQQSLSQTQGNDKAGFY